MIHQNVAHRARREREEVLAVVPRAVLIVGGTGRFANATGEMKAEGVATLATSSTAVTITSGWITY